MKFPEETLMAYADGELDVDARNAVEAAMAADPHVAADVARHRALRARLNAAFDGALHEAVPDRLIDAARTAPTSLGAQVADIGAARDARKTMQRKWSWPEWGAIAASLLVGVVVSRVALDGGGADSIVAKNGAMVADGTLAAALDTQPGGAAGSKVRIVASFRAKGGEYCRTFAVDALAGIACRDANDWSVRALAQSEANTTANDYRMAAATLPPSIAQTVAAIMDGDALDAAEENAARARGWK